MDMTQVVGKDQSESNARDYLGRCYKVIDPLGHLVQLKRLPDFVSACLKIPPGRSCVFIIAAVVNSCCGGGTRRYGTQVMGQSQVECHYQTKSWSHFGNRRNSDGSFVNKIEDAFNVVFTLYSVSVADCYGNAALSVSDASIEAAVATYPAGHRAFVALFS